MIDMLEVEKRSLLKAREVFKDTSLETQLDLCVQLSLGDGLVMLMQIYQLIALFSDPETKAKAEEAIDEYRRTSD